MCPFSLPVRIKPDSASAHDQPTGATVKLTDLRAILQCVSQFREKTFIIAVGEGIVTDENFSTSSSISLSCVP
jgi:hypothetical protein